MTSILANAVFTWGKFMSKLTSIIATNPECCVYLRTFNYRIRKKYAGDSQKLQGGRLSIEGEVIQQ